MENCSTSADCSLNLSRTDGPQQCFASSNFLNGSNICGCYLYLGWVGEDCNEESPVLAFNRVFQVFFLISYSLATILALKTVVLEIKLHGKRVFTADVVFLPLILFFIAGFVDSIRFSILLKLTLIQVTLDWFSWIVMYWLIMKSYFPLIFLPLSKQWKQCLLYQGY